jgi:crotonobetainyl-CoA:carnitine CoA-transferase CaiB-like acyl-CoA transferase
MIGPAVQLSKSAGTIHRHAPEYGEHTEEVLLELGYTWEEIAGLRERGAVGAP